MLSVGRERSEEDPILTKDVDVDDIDGSLPETQPLEIKVVLSPSYLETGCQW